MTSTATTTPPVNPEPPVVHLRNCPLCEAGCGLQIGVRDRRAVFIRADPEDVFSAGYMCTKGKSLIQLHDDVDRVRTPLIKRDGRHVEARWDDAFDEIERLFRPILAEHGRDAAGVYIGNPMAHSLPLMLYTRVLLKSLGTRMLFSAGTLDQRPKDLSSALMFGDKSTCPLPDIDRTHFLLILGANPVETNGSKAITPNWPGKLADLKARGGRLVVVDPRRTRTAALADDHLAIRPGGDAFLLLAMIHVLIQEELIAHGDVASLIGNAGPVLELARAVPPERVFRWVGIAPDRIRQLARDFAAAPAACAYGRMGTSTGHHGSVTSWLIDVLNTLTGNLDRPGGAMFGRTAAAWASTTRGRPRYGRGVRVGNFTSRVGKYPEFLGELPMHCLAEEIDTPGPGQLRALITIAGNPVLSSPNARRLDEALSGLGAMVSVDCYLNETTRHANVILPAPSPLEKSHYDVYLMQSALRSVANYSPAVVDLDPGLIPEWHLMCRLALAVDLDRHVEGDSANQVAVMDTETVSSMVRSATRDRYSSVAGRDPDELISMLSPRTGPERMLDLLLRTGPFGDAFGRTPHGLTLDLLEENPHGLDFGPLIPRLPVALRTPDGMINLSPEMLVAEVRAMLDEQLPEGLLLIGRRQLRSNNSWMHNLPHLVSGQERCTLLMHPTDAAIDSLQSGDEVEVFNGTGSIRVHVTVTQDIRPGVVSLPHGWGHDIAGTRQGVARRHGGANANELSPNALHDPITGTAVLNGIPVSVRRAERNRIAEPAGWLE